MLQAPLVDGVAFDPFSFLQNGLATSEVDVGGCQVLQALVVSAMIVVVNESADLPL